MTKPQAAAEQLVKVMTMNSGELSAKASEIFEAWAEKKGLEGKAKERAFQDFLRLVQKSKYEPGEAIGVIAAQSISEPATQMTMRTYTLATQRDRLSKVTQGLPRLVEIFDVRKTLEKNMKIFLKPEYNNKDDATRVANFIKSRKVADVVASDSIDLANMQIELDLERSEEAEGIKRLCEKLQVVVESRGKKVSIKPKKDDIKSLRKIRAKLLHAHVEGIKGIEEVVVVKEGEDWIIQTSGTNLKKVLNLPEVDGRRTTTNDIEQVYDVLGVEAARNIILQETRDTLDEQGLDIDVRHLLLLADTMTVDGEVKPIGRYGISGQKASVLARANFEETKKHIINASFYGESDMLRGVIENVLVGGIVPVGTGIVKLGVDVAKLKAAAE
jgi:DNA-directed RNA polymerase subunit A"